MNVDLKGLLSRVLGIAQEEVTDDLTYLSAPAWDSFRHVELMLALEEATGVRISDELVTRLTSLPAIREFFSSDAAAMDQGPEKAIKEVQVARGLRGIHLDHSSICSIDGTAGRLEYRGYDVRDLVEGSTFEEVAWLLIHGELPSPSELAKFRGELTASIILPHTIADIIPSLKTSHPIDALRVGLAMMSAYDTGSRGEGADQLVSSGIRLIGQLAAFISAHHRYRRGQPLVTPKADRGLAYNLAILLSDAKDSEDLAATLDTDLILHAEHGSCASTLAARTAIGTGTPVSYALMAAISVFSGPLHGGAVEKTLDMIDNIGDPATVPRYVQDRQKRNAPIYGFGHSVYRTMDPRSSIMKERVKQMSRTSGEIRGEATVNALVASMRPFSVHGIHPNVDLYAGLIYRAMGFSNDLSVPIFVIARMAGWIAHCREQRERNILIRPLLNYVGPPSRKFECGTRRLEELQLSQSSQRAAHDLNDVGVK